MRQVEGIEAREINVDFPLSPTEMDAVRKFLSLAIWRYNALRHAPTITADHMLHMQHAANVVDYLQAVLSANEGNRAH